jgi:hypothetical protein
MIENIGLEEDLNNNLNRRMLFLFESVYATNQASYNAVRKELLDRYLDQSVKDFRPPRFLLNDVIRYWRTMCVDFAGKEHEDQRKWGLRNVKLRTARKVLLAGGLLPVFECATLRGVHLVGHPPYYAAAEIAWPVLGGPPLRDLIYGRSSSHVSFVYSRAIEASLRDTKEAGWIR